MVGKQSIKTGGTGHAGDTGTGTISYSNVSNIGCTYEYSAKICVIEAIPNNVGLTGMAMIVMT